MLGPTVLTPPVRPRADQPAFGGDRYIVIRMQRLADQLRAHERPIAVSRVDEVDAQPDRPAQAPDRLTPVRRLPPDTPAGETHRAVPEAGDRHVAAQREDAAGRRHELVVCHTA